MLKLLKNFGKREWCFVLISFVLIFGQVWLELKVPDYMSQITILVQTEGSSMKDILINGGYMLLCKFDFSRYRGVHYCKSFRFIFEKNT